MARSLGLAACALLAACAAPRDAARDGPRPIPEGMARITVLRPGAFAGSARYPMVLMNDAPTCDIYNGAYFEVDVPAGGVTVTARGTGLFFPTLNGQVEAGHNHYVEIGFGMIDPYVRPSSPERARPLVARMTRAQCANGYNALRGTRGQGDRGWAPLFAENPRAPGSAIVPRPPPSVGTGAPVPNPAAEMAFWDAIKSSTDPADYRAYLETFPRGQFAALARVRAGLEGVAVAAPVPAPQAAL
ncbi:MAG: hypothetical protein FJ399_23655, partial [Verrucomicrobia bacterium]|nr:hypothetical protein [Verrucomicrobiota bacterium]